MTMAMEETKFAVDDFKPTSPLSPPSTLNIPEVNNKHSEANILEACEAEFETCESIADFYEKFRDSVCRNLKKKGYRVGDLELLQDEILSPTFEEVIILWCLDKVQPNLSRKIRPEFNDKLSTGVSMIQLKDEIFQYCSQKSVLNQKYKPAKDEPETLPEGPELDIKEEKRSDYPDFNNDEFPIQLDDNFINNIMDNQIENENQDEDEENGEDYDDSNDATWWQDNELNDDEDYKDKGPGRKRSKAYENVTKYNAPMSCDICGKTYAGKRRLNEHYERKHNKPEKTKAKKQQKKTSFLCKPCEISFPTSEERKAHRLEMHKPEQKMEICPYCGKMMNIYSKKRHILSHTSDITCSLCKEKLATQEDLEAHMKKHEQNPSYRMTQKKTIKCSTCKRGFTNPQEYGLHICRHFDCDVCEARFMKQRNLEVHKKFHQGEQVFSCDMCEALFLKRKLLYCHKRSTHDEDKKKFECQECGKAFLKPCKLKIHMQKHSSFKPFKCDICHKSFKQKHGLNYHMQSHTGKVFTVPCVSCDEKFFDTVTMKLHRESGQCDMKMEHIPTKIES